MLARPSSDQTRLLLAASGRLSGVVGDRSIRAREIVLREVEKKFRSDLPQAAFDFEPFEALDGRIRAEHFRDEDVDAWSIRFSEPCQQVAGRDWIVEASSVNAKGTETFSCRLSCFSRDRNFSFIPSTPNVLKEVVQNIGLSNSGFVLNPEAQEIGVDLSVEDLTRQLVSPVRWWNVIVVSESRDQRYGLSQEVLQRNLLGIANVFFLPFEYEGEFEASVGSAFRLYAGGVRTFRAGFAPEISEKISHPVLAAPANGDAASRDRAVEIIGRDAFNASVARDSLRSEAVGFFDVRQRATVVRLKTHNSDRGLGRGDELQKAREALRAANEEIELATELGRQAENDRNAYKEQLDGEKSKVQRLLVRQEWLEKRLRDEQKNTISAVPQSYQDMPHWIEENFSGKVKLLPRARKALVSASYYRIGDVAKAIELLAEQYRNMRLGVISRTNFDADVNEAGFTLSGSIDRSRAGQEGDTYFVDYKQHRTFIEWHLKKGTSHDTRHALRVYFFFDEEDSEVILCSLPAHLPNRLT